MSDTNEISLETDVGIRLNNAARYFISSLSVTLIKTCQNTAIGAKQPSISYPRCISDAERLVYDGKVLYWKYTSGNERGSLLVASSLRFLCEEYTFLYRRPIHTERFRLLLSRDSRTALPHYSLSLYFYFSFVPFVGDSYFSLLGWSTEKRCCTTPGRFPRFVEFRTIGLVNYICNYVCMCIYVRRSRLRELSLHRSWL